MISNNKGTFVLVLNLEDKEEIDCSNICILSGFVIYYFLFRYLTAFNYLYYFKIITKIPI
jgi:hypothetical protein